MTYVTVFTAYIGNPDVVLNAGRSILPKSSARASRMGSPDTAYADKVPPKYRMTVSKNGANESLHGAQCLNSGVHKLHTWSIVKVDFATSSKDSWNTS